MIPNLKHVILWISLFNVIHGISPEESSLFETVLSDIKILNEKVKSLENIVDGQNGMIAELRLTVSKQNAWIADLERTNTQQNAQIADLETAYSGQNTNNRNAKLEPKFNGLVSMGTAKAHVVDRSVAETDTERIETHDLDLEDHRRTQAVHSSIRKERLLNDIQNFPTSNPDGIIAFYAIMSASEKSPSTHHTLVFDVAKTNVGNGYNHFTGVFTAPRDGIYVFVWVIRMHVAEHSTELMIDSDVYGATFLRAKSNDDGSVSGTVVAEVSSGQSVYVRIHSTYAGDGDVLSNVHGQPSFSGWLLR